MIRAAADEVILIKALSLDEPKAWRPPGTVCDTVRIPVSAGDPARRILRNAGYRVGEGSGFPCSDDDQLVEVLRHYGTAQPGIEAQAGQMAEIENRLASAKIVSVHVAHGIVAGGGTPAHRWLHVRCNGTPVVKVLAATASDVDEQLDRVATSFGLRDGDAESLSFFEPPANLRQPV